MAAFSTIALIGAAAIGTAGVISQRQAARESAQIGRAQARQMEEIAALEKKKADIANARALRSSLRQARLARGSLINLGAQTGTSGSSGILGGLASLGTQEGVNRGVFAQGQDIAEKQYQTTVEMSHLHSAAAGATKRAMTGQLLTNVGKMGFNMAGGYTTLFGV